MVDTWLFNAVKTAKVIIMVQWSWWSWWWLWCRLVSCWLFKAVQTATIIFTVMKWWWWWWCRWSVVGCLTPFKQPSSYSRRSSNDVDKILIDRSRRPGKKSTYSFRIILSVLLGAQIHRQIYPPPLVHFDNPVRVLKDESGQEIQRAARDSNL